MTRWMVCGLSLLLFGMVGCRSYPGNAGCSSGLLIPPPATYSPRAPGVGQNPYYNGQVASNNVGLLNPAGQAPTSATQAGWRSSDEANSNFSLGSGSQQQPNSVLQRTAPQNTTPTNGNSGINSAQPTPQGSGVSFRNSPNYRSTTVDESQDRSRLVLTDASQVRAPALASIPSGLSRLPQGPVVVQGQTRLVGGNPAPNLQYYSQTPTLVSGGYSVPAVSSVSYGAPTPQVQSQSTATYEPTSSDSYRNGWRDSQRY